MHIPSLRSVAKGFGLEHNVVASREEIEPVLRLHRQHRLPRLVECLVDPRQLREPRLVSKAANGRFHTPALHDMSPPLMPETKKILNGIFESAGFKIDF